MSGLKQGLDPQIELINHLPELEVWTGWDIRVLQEEDVSQYPYIRGGYLTNKILGNSDVERDYSSLTLYRCLLLSPIKNALSIGAYDFSKNKYIILDRIFNGLNLSNAHIRGQSLELEGANLRSVTATSSLIENYIFKECRFRKCDFRGTRFVNVKFLGSKLYDSNFEGCSFESCKFDDAFGDEEDDWLDNTEIDDRSSFKNTRFEDCNFWWYIYDPSSEHSKLFIRMFEGSNIASNDLPDIM